MSRALLYAALLAASPAVAATVPPDGTVVGFGGRSWETYTQDATHLHLQQDGDTLSVVSTAGGTPRTDALYLSHDFALSTAGDFSITLDYALSGTVANAGSAGDAVGLDFGVGTDRAGGDSAAVGVGYADPFGFVVVPSGTVAYRTDNGPDATLAGPNLAPLTGTLEIDYDYADDRLTLGRVGSPTLTASLPDGTVRGTWGASALLVSVGGRTGHVGTGVYTGIAADAGSITMDNFVIASGTIVPEPATLAVLGTVTLTLRRIRKRG